MTIVRKYAAHDRWACFACRWTQKIELVDVRVADRPSYLCPKCRVKMVWTGTAFRPPRRSDDEGWQVAEQLIAGGFRYYASHDVAHRVPKKLKDVAPWLAARAATPSWQAETKFRASELSNREPVLIWHEGTWREGCVRTRGDGNRQLPTPIVVVGTQRITVTAKTRLRVRA